MWTLQNPSQHVTTGGVISAALLHVLVARVSYHVRTILFSLKILLFEKKIKNDGTLLKPHSTIFKLLRKMEVADLQQQTRKNNVVITGIPVTTQENVYAILEKLASVLGVEYKGFDISTAHRLRQGSAVPGKNRVPPSIVVNFVSRLIKSIWLTARKHKKRLSASEINRNFPDHPVYMNDHLAHKGDFQRSGSR
ncbi:uncharacterized protein LOC120354347 [Nilaparvata lugens]|uniref:uncharacterized protein LOC120354347 n=1 Tax=Nilaparvata lugens TaxID=108931 RepID=UPI00193CD1B2|nr:uncharacterized protein LOC120354347 [Nilaparvata lugens]